MNNKQIEMLKSIGFDLKKRQIKKRDWYNISVQSGISEEFMREYSRKIDWIDISAFQKLSEDFMREFKDYVNWHHISMDQKMSESFIDEFKDRFTFDNLFENEHIPFSYVKKNFLKFKRIADGNIMISRFSDSEKSELMKIYNLKNIFTATNQ